MNIYAQWAYQPKQLRAVVAGFSDERLEMWLYAYGCDYHIRISFVGGDTPLFTLSNFTPTWIENKMHLLAHQIEAFITPYQWGTKPIPAKTIGATMQPSVQGYIDFIVEGHTDAQRLACLDYIWESIEAVLKIYHGEKS